ncbi:S8 family serine peptidase [Aestuariibacter sp. AA17]|uniref:S8 family serine peptidase n=1 Tax=Fluctibacter corallii TaxID=2984329 RepID=A0ABT3AA27_9ALTE|nr:S8 family peptidase [Aestuariibacter sp. AA17]MCV2885531.1 S8 family serine peptidase [Aestuariibacter sp. AA17]
MKNALVRKRSALFGTLFSTCLGLATSVTFNVTAQEIESDTLEPLSPRIVNQQDTNYPVLPLEDIDGIVIKFIEGSGVRIKHNGRLVPNQSKKLKNALPTAMGSWDVAQTYLDQLELDFKLNKLRKLSPLFSLDEGLIEDLKIKGQKKKGRELADLNLYFHVDVPKHMTQTQLADLLQSLNKNPLVEVAYANPKPEPASLPIDYDCPILTGCEDPPGGGGGGGTTTPTPDYQGRQGYLLPASQGGIDAMFSWTQSGGTGSGIKVVDIESGFNFNHEDIKPAFYFDGTNGADRDHGTAVVGVVGAKRDNQGVTGISYNAQVGAQAPGGSFSSRILDAGNTVGNGGVVIIEAHQQSGIHTVCSCNEPQCGFVAMENWQANFDAIATIVANGVTVIEAGGNGSVSLDDPHFAGRFNRNVRDSGAILVGASTSTTRTPMCWSNTGSRIDMHGWGENVTTTGYGDLFDEGTNRLYTSRFAGTSSASPIVAGAAINVQGYARSALSRTIEPHTMRELLVSTGTPQTGNGGNIGPLPDIRGAIEELNDQLLPPTLSVDSFACYGQNTLTWNGVPGATSYKVYVSTYSSTPPSGPTYTVTNTYKYVNVSQTSYAWVKACNGSECSDYSNRVSVRRLSACF